MLKPARKSPAALLASLVEAERGAFLDELSGNALAAMPWLWEVWAHPDHQCEPEGDWQTWVILGGRGAGKTRAGAEWIRSQVEGAMPLSPGRSSRVALVGETIDQVRAVMVEGESGLLAVSPPDRRPEFKSSLNKLIWPNGAEAMLMSAANPEALRGPQFDCAWADELAKWTKCRDAWDMLQFCLRLGDRPRQVVTTTPRDNDVLIEIMEDAHSVVTHAGTQANQVNLAPDLDRIVVAVDPPMSSGENADECGIVVAGVSRRGGPSEWKVYVLADLSVAGHSPLAWAEVAAEAYRDFQADRLVAEVNQGGDLVESVMRNVDPQISYRAVWATRGKRLRAEPVAALYEQGRVRHVGCFPELEHQLCHFVVESRSGIKSPDRLDALVWALTDLVLGDFGPKDPRVRRL